MNKEVFMYNIQALNDAADIIMGETNGERIPQVCFIRAMRTILDIDSDKKIKYQNKEDLIYEVLQIVYEFIIFHPEINADWVIDRNCCIPVLTKEEEAAIQPFIDKVREVNKEYIK